MSFTLQNPFQYFNNPNNSNPVGLGRLYVGLPDTDPEQVGNRVTVKAVQQNGTEITLAQPVQLLAGGVPALNGAPVQLKIENAEVSVKVTTMQGAQVYYAARYSFTVSAEQVQINNSETLADLAGYLQSTKTFYPEQFFISGETGHEGMINRAVQAARDAGGGIVELGGIVRPIAGTVVLQRGVLLRGSGGCDYSLYPIIHGSVLKPTAGFNGETILILDSTLENLPLLSGAGMEGFAIDCDNITLTNKTIIKLKSASNLRQFKDITVINNDNCIALEINEATVNGLPSGIATDGLEFVNFFTYAKTGHARTNPIAIIAGNANEVTFRGGKFQCKAAAAAGTRAVDIYSGSRGVTFDGTAFAGCETLVTIVGLNNFAGSPPEWIRFFNGTFETYRYGINITSTGTNPIYYPRFITIDKSNRFITATGANPRKVIVDRSNGVSVELDEFFEGSTMLEITGNALACVGFAQLSSVINSSTTSVVMGRNGNALQVQRTYLEPTIAPNLLNSWVNGSPTNRSLAGYFKDDKGIVHLQGYLSGGSAGTVAFTLPAGYRPALGVEIAAASGGSGGRVTIENNGNVTIAVFTSFISLDGITFRAEP